MKPTARQIYAIARILLKQAGLRWPATRSDASELIDRLRGTPSPGDIHH